MENLLKGVYKRVDSKGNERFVASFTYKNKHISLGSFDSERAANSAYNEAIALTSTKSHKTIDDYDETTTLDFFKWVTIINFRDNGLYVKNPIYLRRRYFEYYLSTSDIMKFSADELFYYSNHKILRRGRHFFVADYGMQVNILSRYGIRNFAVAGRDYVFVNGDDLDFRYENIQIINRYTGVRMEKKYPKPVYVVKINIRGAVIVGRYDDEVKAAIAYNKAVDHLADKGFNKNYELNYIDDLTDSQYESLYKATALSKKFLSFVSSISF